MLKGIQSIRSEQLCGFNPLSLHHMGQPIQLILITPCSNTISKGARIFLREKLNQSVHMNKPQLYVAPHPMISSDFPDLPHSVSCP